MASPTASSLLSDFNDYSSDFLETPSVSESLKNFANTAILSYTSVLISQPFEVAKTVLQCQHVPRKQPQHDKQKKRMEEEFGENFDEVLKARSLTFDLVGSIAKLPASSRKKIRMMRSATFKPRESHRRTRHRFGHRRGVCGK